jgi:hypothetical protein
MARTAKAKASKRKVPEAGPPAPLGVWTPAELAAAIARGSIEDDIVLLRTSGILDENGELAKKYRTWGPKVSRTPMIEDKD